MPREEPSEPPASADARPTDVSVLGIALRHDRVAVVVVGIALVGLALRLVALGTRPFHWEEARVGYWALRSLDAGAYQYRPVAGGPLVHLLAQASITALGPSEFAARFPIALLSGMLPLSALLFRDRLRDSETMLFALVLGVQPLVLYYSRFLRGDVPLAVFGLASLGFALRAWDRESRRDAYAAAITLPLAASASGFVAGYLLCWLGAWLLVVEQRPVATGNSGAVWATLRTLRQRLTGGVIPAARASLLAVGTTVFLFAPREGPGVGAGLYDPGDLPVVLYEGTVGALWRFVGVRIVHRSPEGAHAILPYVRDAIGLVSAVALPVFIVGVIVTLLTRHARSRRPLVEGVGYWGILGVGVFPTITEVSAPWVLVHVVVPLSLPASVGFAALIRRGVAAASQSEHSAIDAGTVAAVALVVLTVGAQTGAAAASGVYGPSDRSNQFAQYAQPTADLEYVESAVEVAAADASTPTVAYVGPEFSVPDEQALRSPPVGDAFGKRLPLPWYVESAGGETTSAVNASVFAARYREARPPPVVITDPASRSPLSETLGSEYEATTPRVGLWNREIVVFVDRTVAQRANSTSERPRLDR
ncbi:MAG: flippase activity-associated protein Agl23 [Halobellus sp.]|uniref:flippase activity-associated protein Agl23 n=1 Tax=Halobellus sp. TaxID=1979212 RepID=UPI0035D4B5EF